jgi:tetratricopeptide (TPR) repeat protein
MDILKVPGRYEFIRAMSILPLLLCFGLIVMPAKLLFGQPFENYRQLTDTVIYSPSLGYDKKISLTVPSEYDDTLPGLKRDILEHYGAELRFAPGVLNGKGWFFFSEGDFKNAIRAWEITLNYYPGFSEIFLNIANAQKELAEDFSGSLQQLRESLKTTRFYSDTELLELLHAADEMEKSVNSTSPKPE